VCGKGIHEKRPFEEGWLAVRAEFEAIASSEVPPLHTLPSAIAVDDAQAAEGPAAPPQSALAEDIGLAPANTRYRPDG